jgi:hypothetical protein
MSGLRITARLGAAAVVLVLAAGCTGTPTDRVMPPATPHAADDILRFEQLGGGPCPPGGCDTDIRIKTDGSWAIANGSPEPRVVQTGKLDDAATGDLKARIATGINSVGALPPYLGPCPFAIDAPETVWTFTSNGRRVMASNCRKVFGANPLIAYASQLVGGLRYPAPVGRAPVPPG